MAAPEPVSTRGMKNQVRIRGPKPDVSFQCKSLDEMETRLQSHVETCFEGRPIPETVYAQFIFDSAVILQIKDLSDGIRDHFPHLSAHEAEDEPGQLRVPDAVAPAEDAKTKLRRQRAVGRIILKSISNVDNFKYFEKEAWDTKHQDGYRFKYLCRDSYQNKDRTANKGRGSNASTLIPPTSAEASAEQSPGKVPDATRLPTYDCKGSIFVKFSQSQQIIDVVYQHFPVHREIPPGTQLPGSRSEATSDINGSGRNDSGDLMDTTETVPYEIPGSLPLNHFAAAPVSAPKKKRKRTVKVARESMAEIESSDPMLDDEYDMDDQAPPLPLVSPTFEPDPGDADFYRPSVVTVVPGQTMKKKPAGRQSYRAASEGSSSGSAYEGKSLKKKTAVKQNSKPKQKATGP